MQRTGIAAVAAREAAWIWRDPVALLLTIFAPLLAFALLAGAFSNAVIRGLHIDVVDADRSATSAALVQAIDAAPGVTVALRSTDLTSAMHAIRSGAAIAAVYVPENFERDLLADKRPQIVNFYNRQFFTPGNIAAAGVQAATAAAVAALPKRSLSHSWAPGPLVVEQYVLNNPALNYIQFLARATMPTVLHVMIAVAGAFSVGSEFGRRRNMREWLETAGRSTLAALVGKFAPYCAIFLAMMVVASGILHAVYQIPFRGDPVLVAASACLLIVAYFFLGAFAVLLVRNLAVGLSLTGIICSPAFGFAGVGFPAIAMGGFAQAWGSALPLRWYIQILFDQGARGAPRSIRFPRSGGSQLSRRCCSRWRGQERGSFLWQVRNVRNSSRPPNTRVPWSRARSRANICACCVTAAPLASSSSGRSSTRRSIRNPISDSLFATFPSASSMTTIRKSAG